MSRVMRRKIRLTPQEREIILGSVSDLPPLLTIDEVVRLSKRSKSCIYEYVSTGKLHRSVCRSGGLMFHRDLLVLELMDAL